MLCTATQAGAAPSGRLRNTASTSRPNGSSHPTPQGTFHEAETRRGRNACRRRWTTASSRRASPAQPQMLCIVNTRLHAQELFARIEDLPGAVPSFDADVSGASAPRAGRTARGAAETRSRPVRIVLDLADRGRRRHRPARGLACRRGRGEHRASRRSRQIGKESSPALGPRGDLRSGRDEKLHPGNQRGVAGCPRDPAKPAPSRSTSTAFEITFG